ncbi:uncharacterized protein LOC110693657 isoform X2 [Chenopodium quinoa]|uniref:uncharacterized protein LOC110693657 isoform X2 n=1 Tax=Chenopodium quinoa TaxID=63459 RepID=UPI000B78D594|nr:uncharacterized protein LOC110693657 isoform X2 [Chenopodium quinoa]
MAIQSRKIAIPFQPLLGQLVDCLNFPKPIYGFIDKDRNNACVCIRTECGKSEFVFFGGEANTVQESQERAAQKAVQKLMSQFGVQVSDFTSNRARMYQLCSKLFKHKVVELCREKGIEMPTAQKNLGKKPSNEVIHVTIDFVSFLGAVVTRTGAEVSPLETIWVEDLGFVSWLTVSCPHNGAEMECIYSDPCPEVTGVKQKAAKRAIHYLVTKYSLEIIDANYGAALEKSVACNAFKSRFYQLKEHLAAREENFAGDECLTPTSERFQIPKVGVPPPAPMKRRSATPLDAASSSTIRVSEPLVSGIPELETVWKRTKFAYVIWSLSLVFWVARCLPD